MFLLKVSHFFAVPVFSSRIVSAVANKSTFLVIVVGAAISFFFVPLFLCEKIYTDVVQSPNILSCDYLNPSFSFVLRLRWRFTRSLRIIVGLGSRLLLVSIVAGVVDSLNGLHVLFLDAMETLAKSKTTAAALGIFVICVTVIVGLV